MDSQPKKRIKMEYFQSDEKIKLIKAVEARPIIWDFADKHYLDHHLLFKTWESVGAELNKTGKACKRAWTSLRDSLRYHTKKMRESDSVGGGSNEMVEWQYARHLAFLTPVLSERRKILTNTLVQRPRSTERSECIVKSEPLSPESVRPFNNDAVEEPSNTSSYEYQSQETARSVESGNFKQLVEFINELVKQRKRTSRPVLKQWDDLINELPKEKQREVEMQITELLLDVLAYK